MTRDEMLAKMAEIGCDGRSKLKMRSEKIQNGQRSKKYARLKKGLKKKSKLLVLTEIAVPFNPETGEEDEMFNYGTKYRPPFSATTVALSLKELANENEVTKQAFMERAGVDTWDTSDATKLTKEDWDIFKKYRVPRIFTIPTVRVNVPVITKSPYGKEYAIHVKRDEDTGEILGEVPVVLQLQRMYQSILYAEVKEYTDKIDRGEINVTEQARKEHISNIYKRNPYSQDHPSNFVMAVELPLTNSYEVSADVSLKNLSETDLFNMTIYSSLSKELRISIDKYKSGEFGRYDTNFDFFEIDMACPTEGNDTTDDGKRDIGKDTKFEKPTVKIEECDAEHSFLNALHKYLDEETDCEETMRRSVYIPPYTEELANQLITSLPTVLDIEKNQYVTNDILINNATLISLAYGDRGDVLIEEADAGVSGRPTAEYTEEDVAKSAQQFDLNSEEFNDDFDNVELEEVAM